MADDGLKTSTTILGTANLKAALAKLSDRMAEDALRKAGMAGALLIENAAKQKAPKKTRTLSRSIHSEVIEASRDAVTVQIGTDVEYAAIQEFGGAVHQTNAFGMGIEQTINIPAQPYLRPALAENGDRAGAAAGRVLKQLIDEVAK